MIPPGPAKRIKRLPFSSVWDLFRMTDGKAGYSAVTVKLGSLGDLDRVRTKVRDMGFATFALADQFEQISRAFYFMDMVLAAVGMIAIVVAALGIVNTMVMSILERFREIGVMKAVGRRGRRHPAHLLLRIRRHRLPGRRGRVRPGLGHQPGHQPGGQFLPGPPGRPVHPLFRLPVLDIRRGRRLLGPGQPRLGHLPGPPGRPRRPGRRPQTRLTRDITFHPGKGCP